MTSTGTIARYISLRFFSAITVIFCICLLLIFLMDLVELMRLSGKYKSAVDTRELFWLALLRVPSFAELSIPFAVLAGSMTAFLLLSKSSELIVIRASGMSIWQFVLPGVLVALFLGLAVMTVYNPVAA